jgi:hypothetical protein
MAMICPVIQSLVGSATATIHRATSAGRPRRPRGMRRASSQPEADVGSGWFGAGRLVGEPVEMVEDPPGFGQVEVRLVEHAVDGGRLGVGLVGVADPLLVAVKRPVVGDVVDRLLEVVGDGTRPWTF